MGRLNQKLVQASVIYDLSVIAILLSKLPQEKHVDLMIQLLFALKPPGILYY